jgi:hypothetical protein
VQRGDLQSKLERYNLTKQDLAQLYNKIFDGPTQAYPEDDQLEHQLQQAQGRYNEIQGFLNRESQALNLLQSANSALLGCNSKMQEALSYSQWGARSLDISFSLTDLPCRYVGWWHVSGTFSASVGTPISLLCAG